MPAPSIDPSLRRHRWLASAGFAAFLLHASLKAQTGTLPELLWGCNVTALLMVAGFAFEWPLAVGTAFVWRVALGEPGFLAGLWSGSPYAWTTAFVHVAPTLLAIPFLRRSGLPRASLPAGLALSFLLVLGARLLAPPDLNVNFAHARIPELAAFFPGRWSYRGAVALLVALALLAAERLSALAFGRPGRDLPTRRSGANP